MSNRRSGLGKGLSSLIPGDVDTGDALYREIGINDVIPNQYQPRSHFDEETLASLSASIAEVGVIQPIVVRAIDGGGYELIAGERRWRAAKRTGLPSIPALVREHDDQASLETAVIENLHRQDLNALEEAAAYQQLVEDFGLTQEEVATRVGRSRSAVSNTIRLLQLPPTVQRLVVEGQISAGHARALLSSPDRAAQEAIAQQIVDERLTVRDVEQLMRGDVEDDDPGTDPDRVDPHQAAKTGGGEPNRTASVTEPGILELEELLAARLDTRVRVQLGKGTGKLVIEFADLDDLERIYHVITPPGTLN